MPDTTYCDLAEAAREEVVAIARELVAVPSLSGQEGEVAAVLARRLERLEYDQLWTDAAGNVLGRLGGASKRRVLLNGHMDHVDAGDPAGWPYPPFAATVADGAIWGRAAADMKGALAVQALAPVLLRRAGIVPPCEVLYSAVVMEEVGGIGAQEMLKEITADVGIVGEGNSNQLSNGHRGRVEVVVTAHGVAAHASAPDRAVNPNHMLAALIQRLPSLPLSRAEGLVTSVAPTLYRTEGSSTNVIPERAQLHLDFRNVPGESGESILAGLGPLLRASELPRGRLTAELAWADRRTYTGLTRRQQAAFPAYLLPRDHPVVVRAHEALERALGRPVRVSPWTYTTDGAHLAAAGIPAVGFGPSEESAAHVPTERVSIDAVVEGLAGIMALIMALGSMA